MATNDTCVTLCPYFKVNEGKLDEFKALCERFVELTSREEKCLFYGFSFCGDEVHCREGYSDADGLLRHLENVDAPLQEALGIASIVRLEVHGPEQELARLREPLSALEPRYYVLEYGFRR